MFGSLGGAEILFILVLALLIFGPRKLPQIGRTVGRAMGEFRRATHDLRSSLEQEVATEELRETREKLKGFRDELSDTIDQANPATIARDAVKPAAQPKPADPAPAAPAASESTDGDDGTDRQR